MALNERKYVGKCHANAFILSPIHSFIQHISIDYVPGTVLGLTKAMDTDIQYHGTCILGAETDKNLHRKAMEIILY